MEQASDVLEVLPRFHFWSSSVHAMFMLLDFRKLAYPQEALLKVDN